MFLNTDTTNKVVIGSLWFLYWFIFPPTFICLRWQNTNLDLWSKLVKDVCGKTFLLFGSWMQWSLKSLFTIHSLQNFVADNQIFNSKIFHHLTIFHFHFSVLDTNPSRQSMIKQCFPSLFWSFFSCSSPAKKGFFAGNRLKAAFSGTKDILSNKQPLKYRQVSWSAANSLQNDQ